MNNKKLIPLLLATGAATVSADWDVQYTFDSAELPAEIFTAVNRENSTGFADVLNGMLRVNHGDVLEQTSNTWVMLPIDVDLKAASESVNGPVTAFFQMVHPTVNGSRAIVDVAWGLSNTDPATVLEDRYNSFNAMMRINSGTLGFELRDGGDYLPIAQLETDEVYNVWIVADYTLNFAEIYIQGGQYTTQTNIGLVAFRVNPSAEQTVDYWNIGLSDGNSVDGVKGIDYFLFDNFAIDITGENLALPTITAAETWAGFTVDGDGNVDTGSWLGWVNVTHKPWVYSYELNSWLYIEESNVSASGGWVFAVN